MMTTFKSLTEEVLAATEDLSTVTPADLESLKGRAAAAPRRRARILLHGDPAASRHEMLIAMGLGQYLPPHRNESGAKSYTLLEGALVLVRFDDDGTVRDHQWLAGNRPSVPFMARFERPVWHMCLYVSDPVVYIEHVPGPHTATRFADWAPPPGSKDAFAYLQMLHHTLGIPNVGE
ncbi:WbuC family cupin fold metalloprotein (plasmid) [Azospirillum sp. A26]|uniref:WbuC family cupin fold metalloprotein n=1 Tax=Azospirillum sp. A26 TaxID=3160607 RepID=UPI003672BF4A